MRQNPFVSMKLILAVRNLRRSGGRLWVSLFGIAFATFLMAVQGSLLHSFTLAASRIVDLVDADLWIVGKGTPTFDYVSPISERYAVLALGVDGVRDAGRGIAGWAPIERPNGDRTLVMLIGCRERVSRPASRGAGVGRCARTERFGLGDRCDGCANCSASTATLQIVAGCGPPRLLRWPRPGDSHRSSVHPLIFSDYVDAHRFLRMERTQASFIVLHVAPGHAPASVRDALRSVSPTSTSGRRPSFRGDRGPSGWSRPERAER